MPKCVHFNWVKVKQYFGTAVFHTIMFQLKMQKSTVLEKKMILSGVLIDLKCRWLQYGLAGLEKHQTLARVLIVYFYAFFK